LFKAKFIVIINLIHKNLPEKGLTLTMIKKINILLLFLISLPSLAQNRIGDDDKKTLKLLLQERKDRFEQYTEHLDDKSGFFGFQSKKDVKYINEILKDIVRTDNKIILELDNLSDQTKLQSKSYEFENKIASEDLVTLEMQNRKYLAAIDTLNRQVVFYKSGAERSKVSNAYKWLCLLLFFSTIILYFQLKRIKKKHNEQ